jgi:Tol biopolymer transport system component
MFRMSARQPAFFFVALFAFIAAVDSATAQSTECVSVDATGLVSNGASFGAAISADGLVVAFHSDATKLVAGDTNRSLDVFVRDRALGVTERVSVDSFGAQADAGSALPSISADGQIVAFESSATNLVAGDTNGFTDVFVHDRSTGVTERVSVDSSGAEGDQKSSFAAISADGTVVAFVSYATNLVAGDTNGFPDVFVHDRTTGMTERVSVDSSGAQGNDMSSAPALSADGRIVAFFSGATNLIANDLNQVPDVFVHDRVTGITERVSVDSSGFAGDDGSYAPALSKDGSVVAFFSDATNLVAGDANGVADVFVHDRSAGATERVSVDSRSSEANGPSTDLSLSADGLIVAFRSTATNLVAGDTKGHADVFLHDRTTGITERESVDSAGLQANRDCNAPAISADGRIVAFESQASKLISGDRNGFLSDVFVHEPCAVTASWSNYGAGFPGSNGVPAFTSQQNPELGATISLDLVNSYVNPTIGLLFVGFQRTSIHSGWGGDLLVVPALTLFVTFSSGLDSFTGTLPIDAGLCGTTVDLQAIESDPGAAKGVSFTPGLELVLGR